MCIKTAYFKNAGSFLQQSSRCSRAVWFTVLVVAEVSQKRAVALWLDANASVTVPWSGADAVCAARGTLGWTPTEPLLWEPLRKVHIAVHETMRAKKRKRKIEKEESTELYIPKYHKLHHARHFDVSLRA